MEKQLIPQLRFPEFEGVWLKEKLVNVSEKVAYGMNAAAITFDGVNKYLRITDIDEDARRFIPKPLSSPDGEIEDKFVLKKGDIVFARTGASVGKSYLYDENDGKLLYAGFLIKFNVINAVPYFVFLQTFRESYRKWVQVYSMRSGQPGLNAEEYKLLQFNCPDIKEQQKIAAFLTDVDDKITKLTKKKELLEQYKKGIMQKIFNQELRFKDDNGNDFPDWEEKRLGDIGTFQTSSVDKLTKPNEQHVHLVNYMNVYRHETISNETVETYQVVTANEKQLISSNLLKGDILFTPSSETPTDIGHSVVIFEDIDNAVYSYHLIRFRPSIKLNLMFSHYFCNTSDVLRQLSRFSTGSTRFTISIGNFSKVKVCFPCLEEQTKIANFLSDIDIKIEALNTKIENSKSFKKGLLQQMFV